MQVENNLGLPATVLANTLVAGDGFSLNGVIYCVKATPVGNDLVSGIRFDSLDAVSLAQATQVYKCNVKVVASPIV